MLRLENGSFSLGLSDQGTLDSLVLGGDSHAMNWVIHPDLLKETGYPDYDKRFGALSLTANGRPMESGGPAKPEVARAGEGEAVVRHRFGSVSAEQAYSLAADGSSVRWALTLRNEGEREAEISSCSVWFSLSYVMFRDEDVLRNMNRSCAVFPHIGGDYPKFAAMRRSNGAPHLGVFGLRGRVATLGSYCRYENRFLEQVSPSLDGIVFHKLYLVDDGTACGESAEADWIYGDGYGKLVLGPGEKAEWEFRFAPFADRDDFYAKAAALGHPRWTYTPVLSREGLFEAKLDAADGAAPERIEIREMTPDGPRTTDVTAELGRGASGRYRLRLPIGEPGERKLVARFADGSEDVLVWNVLESLDVILEKRAEWLCEHRFAGADADPRPYAFLPLSNQGESLGKVAFLLQKNLLTKPNPDQIAKAELCAVHDVRGHWFENGDFQAPRRVYGEFYRIFDLDYIAHVYYLLSRCPADTLKLGDRRTYLRWAAEVLIVRLDPDQHESAREKNETRLNGVFILYVAELLRDLRAEGETELFDRLSGLWRRFAKEIAEQSGGYQGAVTEHYFDNAGFGPTCQTLCLTGETELAEKYGQLLLANIGFSNDYRSQNPDRWWEALAYMIHSLWGGLVAASALAAYERLRDPEYAEAAYRSTMAMFACYDWNVRSTAKRLRPGEAASTFSVAAPNLNKPELSRNRFGQSVFYDPEDELFSKLFDGASGDDWDMGEELAAYLLGFGVSTVLYRKDGELICLNGYAEPDGDGWLVTSYAPYPRKYLFLEEDVVYEVPEGADGRRVRFADGRFGPSDDKSQATA